MKFIVQLIAHIVVLVLPGSFAVASTSGVDAYRVQGTSQLEHYRVSLAPLEGAPPIGELHSWVLLVETRDGATFFPNQLAIQGGMPGHGHGFPVEPQISEFLGDGRFLIEGMMFNMAGPWQIRIGIDGPAGWDTAAVQFSVQPAVVSESPGGSWSVQERATLATLALDATAERPLDPSNRHVSNPLAAEFGERLFFDPGLSKRGDVSCATCHDPSRSFSDGHERGGGAASALRNTPGLLGVARQRWFYWDGRRDSLWSQAVTPIETAGEMGSTRVDAVRYVLGDTRYRALYRAIVGEAPDVSDARRYPPGAGPFADKAGRALWKSMQRSERETVNRVFADIGKFIAAFETGIDFSPTRFDAFVRSLAEDDEHRAHQLLSEAEQRGLRLFLDSERSHCLRCHNGSSFSNGGFHNVGTGVFEGAQLDFGRYFAMQAVRVDPFNCYGQYSDAQNDECQALRFSLQRDVPAFMQGAFKVPTLRNVANTAPYFHDGRYANLREVVEHYRNPPGRYSELQALDINDRELDDLVAFLELLTDAETTSAPQ